MRPEVKKALDEEQSKERKVLLYGVLLFVVVAVTLGSIFIPVTSKSIYGITISYTAVQTDEGSKPRVKVKLESGETIVAAFPKHLVFKYGEKAELLEGRTLVGKPTYRMVRYAQLSHNN
jgi:hypothetical protein